MRREKKGEHVKEGLAGKDGKAVKGREGKKVAKRNKATTTMRVNERGRECSCRLMRHAHVGYLPTATSPQSQNFDQ